MAKIILFARDDSAHPSYDKESYHPFDVVDILPDGVSLGEVATNDTFYVVDCDATIEELEYLKQPHYNPIAIDKEILTKRLHSLATLPSGIKSQLIADKRATIPKGILIASVRSKF